MLAVKIAINELLRRVGYQISKVPELRQSDLPAHVDERDAAIWGRVAPFTMTNPERIISLCRAVRYVATAGIEGNYVECGCWKGGSSMAAALAFINAGDTSRDLFLYDTFEEGWPAASEIDINSKGETAQQQWEKALAEGLTGDELWAKMEDVRGAMISTDYPEDRIRLIKGRVEDTIPGSAPENISILRLDTDWYESTRHTLEHLFPCLTLGGILIIDDYGEWQGARKATDEYFAKRNLPIFLQPVDADGCVVGVKTRDAL